VIIFRRLIAFSLLLSALHSAATAANDPRVNEILSKHLEAMGGLTNWSQVESIQLNGTVERDGKTVDVVIIKKRPNQIRATVTLPVPGKEDEAMQLIRAHDGKSAWTATRLAGAPEMQKEELPPEAADQLLADAGVMPLLIKFWREGAKLELLNSKTIDGTRRYVVEANPEGTRNKYTFYISDETYLVTHYENDHPENGRTITQLNDYNSDHGILIPMVNVIENEQTGRSVMTTSSIKFGVGIYEDYFSPAMPTARAKL
jgi:outer membrane lipoprotein-sorting protein